MRALCLAMGNGFVYGCNETEGRVMVIVIMDNCPKCDVEKQTYKDAQFVNVEDLIRGTCDHPSRDNLLMWSVHYDRFPLVFDDPEGEPR